MRGITAAIDPLLRFFMIFRSQHSISGANFIGMLYFFIAVSMFLENKPIKSLDKSLSK